MNLIKGGYMKSSPDGSACVISGALQATKWYRWKDPIGYVTNKVYLSKRHETKGDEDNVKRQKQYATNPEYKKKVNDRNNSETHRENANESRRNRYAIDEEYRKTRLRQPAQETPEKRAKILGYKKSYRTKYGAKIRVSKIKYYKRNKAKVLAKLKRNRATITGQYSALKSRAKRCNLPLEISFEEFVELHKQFCHYCKKPLDPTGFGLDRLDNNAGYVLSNVVSCCKRCNYIKSGRLTEPEALAVITALNNPNAPRETIIYPLTRIISVLRKRPFSIKYLLLKTGAQNRNLEMNITLDEYIGLVSNDMCHYCGGPLPETSYGLDRVDNNGPYVLSNVVPCCGFCNKLKWNILTYEETRVAVRALQDYRKAHNIAPTVVEEEKEIDQN